MFIALSTKMLKQAQDTQGHGHDVDNQLRTVPNPDGPYEVAY